MRYALIFEINEQQRESKRKTKYENIGKRKQEKRETAISLLLGKRFGDNYKEKARYKRVRER